MQFSNIRNYLNAVIAMDAEPFGISNQRNTCFINAVVQCMINVPEIRNFLREYAGTNKQLVDLKDLIETKTIRHNFGAVMRKCYKITKKDGSFGYPHVGNSEEDAREFLTALLNVIFTETPQDSILRDIDNVITSDAVPADKEQWEGLKKIVNALLHYTPSSLWKWFMTMVEEEQVAVIDGTETIIPAGADKANEASGVELVHLFEPNHETLNECWRNFSEPRMNSSNKQFDQSNKIRRKVVFYPINLIISLGRFKATVSGTNFAAQKIRKDIMISKRVHVGDRTYSPKGIVVHIGETIGSGHYVAFIKKGKKWYHISDQSVRPIEGEDKKLIRENAYIVFLRRNKKRDHDN